MNMSTPNRKPTTEDVGKVQISELNAKYFDMNTGLLYKKEPQSSRLSVISNFA